MFPRGRPKACLYLREASRVSLSCLALFNPPRRSITYSAGEGKGWKSGDLQFLQKRNSLAKCFSVLGWEVIRAGEPGGLLSEGSPSVGTQSVWEGGQEGTGRGTVIRGGSITGYR